MFDLVLNAHLYVNTQRDISFLIFGAKKKFLESFVKFWFDIRRKNNILI